jgi:hypothetical protein
VLPRHMYPNFFLQSHAPHTCRIPSGICRVLKGPPNWIVAPELDTDAHTHAHVTLIGSDETIQLSICDWKFTGYHNMFKKYYVLKCALSEKPMYVRYNCYEACAEISRSSRCNSDHNCWNLIYSISSKHSKKIWRARTAEWCPTSIYCQGRLCDCFLETLKKILERHRRTALHCIRRKLKH